MHIPHTRALYGAAYLQHEFPEGGQVRAVPVVEQALHLGDAHGVLVFALHLVDVLRHVGHGGECGAYHTRPLPALLHVG